MILQYVLGRQARQFNQLFPGAGYGGKYVIIMKFFEHLKQLLGLDSNNKTEEERMAKIWQTFDAKNRERK